MTILSRPTAFFNPQQPQPKPRYLRANGRVVAELLPDGTLDRFNWQLLRHPQPSIGYDVDLLQSAQQQGATLARNRNTTQGISYTAPIERIHRLGFTRDHGYGVQVFLPLRFWDVTHADGRITPAKLPVQPAAVQAGLFGEEPTR